MGEVGAVGVVAGMENWSQPLHWQPEACALPIDWVGLAQSCQSSLVNASGFSSGMKVVHDCKTAGAGAGAGKGAEGWGAGEHAR